MNQNFWSHLDILARKLIPFLLALLLMIAGVVPLQLPGLAPIVPAWGLMAVYYWVFHRPDLLPPWTIFLLGLIQDLLSGGHLGVNAFVLLVAYAGIGSLRRFMADAPSGVIWANFLLIAAGAFFLSWCLNCLIAGRLIDPTPALLQCLTTVAFYPVLAWVLARAQRAVVR